MDSKIEIWRKSEIFFKTTLLTTFSVFDLDVMLELGL